MRPDFKIRLGNLTWVLLWSFASAACATSPSGRRQLILVSEERVDAAGIRSFNRLKNREDIVTSADDNKVVQCVVQSLNAALTPPRDWEVVIFQSDEANAFALPGNKIGVNSGLLRVAVTPDQLASVIAHEMGHVIAEHGRERMSQQTSLEGFDFISGIVGRSSPGAASLMGVASGAVQIGILYPFTQTQENEADIIGLELMAKAGFSPHEAINFWRNMDVYNPVSSDSILSGHPSNQSRVENIRSHLAAVANSAPLAKKPKCSL